NPAHRSGHDRLCAGTARESIMPNHVRRQIRDAIKTLVTGLTTTQNRVFVGRTRPLSPEQSPALLVYSTQDPERIEVNSTGPAPSTLLRTMMVTIDGRVSATEPPDDLLDKIADEVEQAIGTGAALASIAKSVSLVQTMAETVAPGDRHEGSIRLKYEII